MRMGRTELVSRTVWTAESDRDIELPARHRQHIRSVVYHLVERDQGKAEGHEFNDRPEPHHRGTDSHTGKSVLTDRRIDDSLRAKTLEQTLAYLVGAIVFGDFLAHQEDVRIPRQFFRERFVEGLAISDLSHPRRAPIGCE